MSIWHLKPKLVQWLEIKGVAWKHFKNVLVMEDWFSLTNAVAHSIQVLALRAAGSAVAVMETGVGWTSRTVSLRQARTLLTWWMTGWRETKELHYIHKRIEWIVLIHRDTAFGTEQNNTQKHLGKYGPEHGNHGDIYRDTALDEGHWVVYRKYNSGNFHQCSLNMRCDILREEKRKKVILVTVL